MESFPSAPSYSSGHDDHELQKMRVLVGSPLKRPPQHQIVVDPLMPPFSSIRSESVKMNVVQNSDSSKEGNITCLADPIDLCIFCTSDFATVSREVHLRTRRVRLLGLEVDLFSIIINIIL